MSYVGKRVLVTGAGGFIGTHLVERLVLEGARTRALVHYNALGAAGWLDSSPARERIEIVFGDVRDQGSVRAAMEGIEIVFHLAALIAIPYSHQAPESYLDANVKGTFNLLSAAREHKIERFVHASTSEVYGSAKTIPIVETHPQEAQSPYAASKIAADRFAQAFHLSFDVPVVTLRPFNTYGPRQSARAIIPTVITQALTQPQILLGNLAPTRDFNFVEDTAEGFLLAGDAPGVIGETIHLGTGREISIGDLAALILAIMGRSLPIVEDSKRIRKKGSEVERLCADPRKAGELLGWAPKVSLELGLLPTITWVERNLERYRPATFIV